MTNQNSCRVWDDKVKALMQVKAIQYEEGGAIISIDCYLSIGTMAYMTDWLIECEGLKNATLLQPTGLQDKNGRIIFEGDIVKWESKEFKTWSQSNIPIGYVIFNSGVFELKRDGFDLCPCIGAINSELEIIGNIYENPELLNRT